MTRAKKARAKRRQEQLAPPPRVRSKGGPRRASPKLLIGVLAVLVAIGIAVGIAVNFAGGGSSSNPGAKPAPLPNAGLARKLFAGIPQHGNILGSPSAPVTMIEYVDLQCPYCRDFETQALPDLVSKYVRSGKLAIEERPIAFIGPDSQTGQSAVIAAAHQNQMFEVTEVLYYNQATENTGWLSADTAKAAGASFASIDYAQFADALGSSSVANQAGSYEQQAQSDHVTHTPTILVGKTGTTPHEVNLSDPADVTPVANAVQKALR